MGDRTSIEWTEATWNPVTGCTSVSPGCDRCYAERWTNRFKRGPFERVQLHPGRLDEPLHWVKPRRIFVCSMGDLFHSAVPWEFVLKVFDIMACVPMHTFQVLTKRPGRMAHFAERIWPKQGGRWQPIREPVGNVWPGTAWPSNVWAGASVESAKYLPRLDVLARVPAPLRFVSCEPLLGRLDLSRYLPCTECGGTGDLAPKGSEGYNITEAACPTCFLSGREKGSVRWVIVGGESGPGARPMHPDWARSIRDQCQEAGVPFFFKCWGGRRRVSSNLLDDRTWEEAP